MTFVGRLVVVGAVSLLTATSGSGADTYVFRFDTSSNSSPCGSFFWHDELIFHNSSSMEASAATNMPCRIPSNSTPTSAIVAA